MKKPASIHAFGQHLRRLREARGWSQQALADAADITKKTIYRMETAQTAPTLDVLVCLAEGLEISLAELVTFAPLPDEATGGTGLLQHLPRVKLPGAAGGK